MKTALTLLAGAVAWMALSWAFAPRVPDTSDALIRLDSARVAAEHRAEIAMANLDAERAMTTAAVALAVDREQEATRRAAQAPRTARATGGTVRALLDSLGASTEALDEHMAADSALGGADGGGQGALRGGAGVWG